jgi:hypothetical protein
MPRMDFEPTTPVFEWAKTVPDLDCVATLIRIKHVIELNGHFRYLTVYFVDHPVTGLFE